LRDKIKKISKTKEIIIKRVGTKVYIKQLEIKYWGMKLNIEGWN
jgi:hypothetical protein